MFSIIRQLEEKNVATEIDILLWSDRMDLVALSNVKGEVALHRLTWTRPWILPPPKENQLVMAMSWRPDGKVLAVGYNSGEVLLLNVENKTTLHTFPIRGEITCITWGQEKSKNRSSKKLLVDEENQTTYTQYIDYSSTFLLDPPNLSPYSSGSGSDENSSESFFQNQTELNILAVGTEEGVIYLSIFGCFSCASVNVSEHLEMKCSIKNVNFSENLSKLFVTIRDAEGHVKLVVLNSSIFETHIKELFCVALKYQQIKALMTYLTNTISTIRETWENILLEFDSKLSKYASKIPAGTLSADFLDLLMFGICSDEMQEFLLQDLTKKGLEKFGQTIEMSYANIQKLLLKNVTKVVQNITYHLAELRGMARFEHRYKILGLSDELLTEAISANGSFLIKTGEMQQIINNSMLNYRAFFRWLYTAIVHLMFENVPPEIPKMTQQDLAYIAEFLQNFDNITSTQNEFGETEKTGFVMERVGQYLADAPLTILPSMDLNEWDQFLLHNNCVRMNPSVIKHHKDLSLVQEYKHLHEKLYDAFKEPHILLSNEIQLHSVIPCLNSSNLNVKTSLINTSNNTLLYVFSSSNPSDGFYITEFDFVARTGRAAFIFMPHCQTESEILASKYLITDISFYTENVLSVLLCENTSVKSAGLFQYPTMLLRDKLQPVCLDVTISNQNVIRLDAGDMGQNVFKSVGMAASKFSVSGSRKVSIVLSENRKKVMLFEMEGEDEEEEDADMTNSTIKESDISMLENSDEV